MKKSNYLIILLVILAFIGFKAYDNFTPSEEEKFTKEALNYLSQKYNKNYKPLVYDYYWNENNDKQWALVVTSEDNDESFMVWKYNKEAVLKDNKSDFKCNQENSSKKIICTLQQGGSKTNTPLYSTEPSKWRFN